jgi:hypothetical protein
MPRRKVETRPLLAIVQDTITSPDYGERAAREFVANLKDAVERKYPATLTKTTTATTGPRKRRPVSGLPNAAGVHPVAAMDAQGDLVS